MKSWVCVVSKNFLFLLSLFIYIYIIISNKFLTDKHIKRGLRWKQVEFWSVQGMIKNVIFTKLHECEEEDLRAEVVTGMLKQ